MLHSTFWNHGAGDLDLPPWAVSMLPMPSDLPFKSLSAQSYQGVGNNGIPKDMHTRAGPQPEGVFLDFLYPPQALAWLQRSKGQQWQRWEKRNSRRLPDGFIVASRGYASTSDQQAPFGHEEEVAEEQLEKFEKFERLEHPQQNPARKPENATTWANMVKEVSRQSEDSVRLPTGMEALEPMLDAPHATNSERDDSFENPFVDSPAELAETGLDALQRLKNVMMSTRAASKVKGSERSRDITDEAWRIYESLGYESRDDSRLKREMLDWLSRRSNSVADSHCLELYHSIPKSERDLQVYEAALSLFLRQEKYLSVLSLHKEALKTIENGHQISKNLFRYAVDRHIWRLALRTAIQHHAAYADAGQASRTRVFWLHVSEIPELLRKAASLGRYLKNAHRHNPIDKATRDFAVRFFEEAITHEVLRPNESPAATIQDKTLSRVAGMRSVFQDLARMGNSAVPIFEESLKALLRPDSRFQYSEVHSTVSYIYFMYRKMPGVRPSQQLLTTLLDRVTEYAGALNKLRRTPNSLSIKTVASEWKRLYGHLNRKAVTRLLSFYARSGLTKAHERWLDYFRSVYPEYKDLKDVLWTTIYLHARRADLDQTQRAFAEIKRLMTEHGDEPDLVCWNLLLHAHSRADDLEGALTNLQNLIHYAKLKPDEYSFHPVLQMLAKRGDVEGTEDLLRQYDELAEKHRVTALISSLILALVKSDSVEEAETVLRETIPKVRAGEVRGSLTGAFNILLTAHALRRDIPSTMRVYRWMRDEKIRMDADSYAALIQALTLYRRTDSAYAILTTVMRDHGVAPTAFHYAMVMVGYTNAGRYKDALKVYNDMLRWNIKPHFSTNYAYLKAKAINEHLEGKRAGEVNDELVPLKETMKELQRLVRMNDGSELAAKQPAIGLKSSNLAEASLTAYFDIVMFIHGKRRCFDAVKELYQQYRQHLADTGKAEDESPIRILTSLMSAHLRAGEHMEVEEYWKLAKDQADEIAPLMPVPELVPVPEEKDVDALALEPSPTDLEHSGKSQGLFKDRDKAKSKEIPIPPKQMPLLDKQAPRLKRPAPARRHILVQPLLYYVLSLFHQSRISDAITTVSRLLLQGYMMDNIGWNSFIESLCRHSPPLTLLAFTLTERFLISHFPGWSRQKKHATSSAEAQRLQYILTRYLRPGQLMPLYPTLVRLAAALLDLRRIEVLGRSSKSAPPQSEKYVGTLREIRKRAPMTLFVVQTMPKVPDEVQTKLLRRE